jgi:hypothetical protein
LDALPLLQTAAAKRLGDLLLKYHDEYLTGAKAPDNEFRDFQNHVVHVSDKYWGGAPSKCHEWLDRARCYLDLGQWSNAAYACGVLSHYFTDPIMPLHTGQSPQEKALHGPMEWSIFKAYDSIFQKFQAEKIHANFELAQDGQWIDKAVLAVARIAHQYYDPLVESFDSALAATQPAAAIGPQCQEILAGLFALAIQGWSKILTRLADETSSSLPTVSLKLTSILATVDMPLAWLTGCWSNSKQRRLVQRQVDEYLRTGRVEKYQPDECLIVEKSRKNDSQFTGNYYSLLDASTDDLCSSSTRCLRTAQPPADPIQAVASATELTAHLPATDQATSTQPASVEVAGSGTMPPTCSAAQTTSDHSSSSDSSTNEVPAHKSQPADDSAQAVPQPAVRPQTGIAVQAQFDSDESSADYAPLSQVRSGLRIFDPAASSSTRGDSAHSVSSSPGSSASRTMGQYKPVATKQVVYLGSPLIEAPSIGPKTAKRFEKIGINDIGQFISANPESLVRGLDTRWITVSLIVDWQDQSRLVCEVPALTGYRAQLLVAVGCRNSWQLRSASPGGLHAQIVALCQTSEGQQILRSAGLPTLDDVSNWVESARMFCNRAAA